MAKRIDRTTRVQKLLEAFEDKYCIPFTEEIDEAPGVATERVLDAIKTLGQAPLLDGPYQRDAGASSYFFRV
jgi:hypothetical protein